MSSVYILYLAFVFIAFLGVRIARESERIAVYRFGKFIGFRSGFTWIIPFIDRAVRVDLDAAVPGWRALSSAELANQLERQLHRIPQPGPPAA